jgi:3-deoxy-D-arabino-heptulosonate 7-phosphate (DAHP) synthase
VSELLSQGDTRRRIARLVTEVMAPEHVPMLAKYTDVMQIGARYSF